MVHMKKLFISLLASFMVLCGCLLFLDPYTLSPLQFVPIIGVVYICLDKVSREHVAMKVEKGNSNLLSLDREI